MFYSNNWYSHVNRVCCFKPRGQGYGIKDTIIVIVKPVSQVFNKEVSTNLKLILCASKLSNFLSQV